MGNGNNQKNSRRFATFPINNFTYQRKKGIITENTQALSISRLPKEILINQTKIKEMTCINQIPKIKIQFQLIMIDNRSIKRGNYTGIDQIQN